MRLWKKKVPPLTGSETYQLIAEEYKRGRLDELNALRGWLGQEAEKYQGEANKNPDRASAARMAEQAAVLYRVRAAVFARILRVSGREIPETEEAMRTGKWANETLLEEDNLNGD
jgi:hypothetical protein